MNQQTNHGSKKMKSNKGFTLIELTATIAIMGILAGVAGYSYLSGLPERRTIAASRDLYAGIQETRAQAINRSQDVTITFDVANDRYIVSDVDGNTIDSNDFPDFIDLYEVTGDDDFYTFNSRGMKNVPSSRVRLQYTGSGALARGVRVTTTGGIRMIDETDDNWN